VTEMRDCIGRMPWDELGAIKDASEWFKPAGGNNPVPTSLRVANAGPGSTAGPVPSGSTAGPVPSGSNAGPVPSDSNAGLVSSDSNAGPVSSGSTAQHEEPQSQEGQDKNNDGGNVSNANSPTPREDNPTPDRSALTTQEEAPDDPEGQDMNIDEPQDKNNDGGTVSNANSPTPREDNPTPDRSALTTQEEAPDDPEGQDMNIDEPHGSQKRKRLTLLGPRPTSPDPTSGADEEAMDVDNATNLSPKVQSDKSLGKRKEPHTYDRPSKKSKGAPTGKIPPRTIKRNKARNQLSEFVQGGSFDAPIDVDNLFVSKGPSFNLLTSNDKPR
jgi:hypothetical protein